MSGNMDYARNLLIDEQHRIESAVYENDQAIKSLNKKNVDLSENSRQIERALRELNTFIYKAGDSGE